MIDLKRNERIQKALKDKTKLVTYWKLIVGTGQHEKVEVKDTRVVNGKVRILTADCREERPMECDYVIITDYIHGIDDRQLKGHSIVIDAKKMEIYQH